MPDVTLAISSRVVISLFRILPDPRGTGYRPSLFPGAGASEVAPPHLNSLNAHGVFIFVADDSSNSRVSGAYPGDHLFLLAQFGCCHKGRLDGTGNLVLDNGAVLPSLL